MSFGRKTRREEKERRNEPENAMMGANEAILRFATRSAVEFPMAKMVRPMIASDKPKISPRTVKTETTSSAANKDKHKETARRRQLYEDRARGCW